MKHAALFALMLLVACAPSASGPEAVIPAAAPELRARGYAAFLDGARSVRFDGESESSKKLAGELSAMAPIFANGRVLTPSFDPPKSGLRTRTWTYRGRDYLVLANPAKDSFQKVPAAALEPGWRPLFEVRRDPRELLYAAHGAHYLKPHQVLVLESRIKPKRLLGL